MPQLEYRAMLRLAAKASRLGRRVSMTRWEWDVAGDCERPELVEYWSRPAADDPAMGRESRRKAREEFAAKGAARIFAGGPPMYSWEKPPSVPGRSKYITVAPGRSQGLLTVEMHTRCRACSPCRKVRSRMWYARAINETLTAHRTWFGTITLNPQANHQSLARARRQVTRRGVIWEELTPDEQFAELHKQNGLHLQLWLKRVRKQSGAPLRFLLVCEAHKSGLPHYHCLLHETDAMRPVRKSTLQDQWKLGFTNFKLVTDPKAAGYLCKYLSKSAAARVRASTRYGQQRSVAIAKRELSFAEGETPTHNEHPSSRPSTRESASVMGGEIVELKGD